MYNFKLKKAKILYINYSQQFKTNQNKKQEMLLLKWCIFVELIDFQNNFWQYIGEYKNQVMVFILAKIIETTLRGLGCCAENSREMTTVKEFVVLHILPFFCAFSSLPHPSSFSHFHNLSGTWPPSSEWNQDGLCSKPFPPAWPLHTTTLCWQQNHLLQGIQCGVWYFLLVIIKIWNA